MTILSLTWESPYLERLPLYWDGAQVFPSHSHSPTSRPHAIISSPSRLSFSANNQPTQPLAAGLPSILASCQPASDWILGWPARHLLGQPPQLAPNFTLKKSPTWHPINLIVSTASVQSDKFENKLSKQRLSHGKLFRSLSICGTLWGDLVVGEWWHQRWWLNSGSCQDAVQCDSTLEDHSQGLL